MDEADASRYWCHMCSQRVSPIMDVGSVKCPICLGGFVEELASAVAAANTATATPGTNGGDSIDLAASDSDRAASLWAPILLGMMTNPRLRRFRSHGFEDEDEEDVSNESNNESIHHHHHHHHHGLGMALDQELVPGISLNRRRANNVLQLLHGIRATMSSDPDNSEDDQRRERETDSDRRDGGRVILINPFNQTIVIQGSFGSNGNSQNVPIGSLGDYFVGPGLELFLQHLAENDPNRYGTPPAMKDAVEALPDVKIEGELQCSVCLEEFENGDQAKEMPCNHKFHSGCILPWLELHSSCPVCRYQLPSDESKINSERSRNNSSVSSNNEDDGSRSEEGGREGRNENGRRFSLPIPWPFSLFASSSPQSSGPSTNAPPSGSHAHDD